MFMDTEIYRRMLAESGDIPEIPKAEAYVAFLAGGNGRLDLAKSLVTIGRTTDATSLSAACFPFWQEIRLQPSAKPPNTTTSAASAAGLNRRSTAKPSADRSG
jgi:hypothetical protein